MGCPSCAARRFAINEQTYFKGISDEIGLFFVIFALLKCTENCCRNRDGKPVPYIVIRIMRLSELCVSSGGYGIRPYKNSL